MMSLRSALEAFSQVFKRKGSGMSMRDALGEFAHAFTPEATAAGLTERHKLSHLAQQVLMLSTAAGKEDNKLLAGACTLLAGVLTKRAGAEAYGSDSDWRWLATWPDLLVDYLDGGYGEAEALVCHLLDPMWAESLSSGGVDVLLERLRELPDAPGEVSPALISLYVEYRSAHQTDHQAARLPDAAEAEGIEPAFTNQVLADQQDMIGYDSVNASVAGIVAHSPEVFDPVMESSVTRFIPANDDVAGDDSGANGSDGGDCGSDGAAAGSFSEMMLYDDESVVPDMDVHVQEMNGPEVNAAEVNAADSNDGVLLEDVTSFGLEISAEEISAEEISVEEISVEEISVEEISVEETGSGENCAADAREDNDVDEHSDAGAGANASGDATAVDAYVDAQQEVDESAMFDAMSSSQDEDGAAIDTAGSVFDEFGADSDDAKVVEHFGDETPQAAVQLESAPAESDDIGAYTGDANPLESNNSELAHAGSFEQGGFEQTGFGQSGIEQGNSDQGDFEQNVVAADEEMEIALRTLNEQGIADQGWDDKDLDKQREASPALENVFDTFDGTLIGSEKTMNLGDFVLPEDAPTTINEDALVVVVAESADGEQPGLLASLKSFVFGSKGKGDDVADVVATNTTSASADQGLPVVAPAGRSLSRAAMQIVEVLLAELPEVETELGICAGLGASSTTDRSLVGEAARRCAEVLQRYAGAADSVGFVGLAKVIDVAREHVLGVAQVEVLSDREVGMFSAFPGVVHAYLEAPYAPDSAQPLLDWINSDKWASPIAIDNPKALRSLLANADLSTIEEDVPARQESANPEDVLLALPEDADRDLLDGLLQELPLQSEEFSAAIERLMHGGKLEDILIAQRIAHTIKGSGNTVGIRGLASLTHNLEDILLVLAQENRLPTRSLAEMLMNAADCLQAMTESLLGMGPPPDDALEVLQSVLDWANLIDREGLPHGDAIPESMLQPTGAAPESTAQPSGAVPESTAQQPTGAVPESTAQQPTGAVPATASPLSSAASNAPADSASRATPADATLAQQSDAKADDELEALLRVPTRLVDQMLTTAGESIILTGQLRERVRRGLADVRAMFAQFERQQQLGSELEEMIDVKDFSRRHAQHDSQFDALEMDQYNELHSTARQMVETATDSRQMGRTIVDHLTELDEMLISQEGLNRDSQDTVLRTRMVAVKSVFPRLQRSVRQTCRATDKQVELHLSGGDTPMDSDGLNRIVDPLMHLLRNAIDHGIEDAATRLRAGKPVIGNVYLDFQRDGNNIVINCRDDGAGLDFDAIRSTAEERGLIAPDASLEALKQVILRSNFSTRSQATQVSGRGIGLDVVHNGVSQLGGTMSVESKTARGCSFEMRLPFNLISSHALLVQAGPAVVALASRGVEQIVHGRDGELQRFGDKTVFQIDDKVYPATTLETVIGANYERREDDRHARPLVLTRTDEGVIAVSVEAVIGSRDLVVKSLGKNLPKLRGIVGATILGDGQVASVIDLPELLSNRNVGVEVVTSTGSNTLADRGSGFVLVVDDSLSARKALAQFMQDSGYKVRTARDGVEAKQIMEGVRPDLVLADLEMPRMNGIELTVHMRSHAETADIPVIMVTSRSTVKHREQATAAGVTVYLSKPYSEDTLIETVRGLLGEQEARRHERSAA